MKTCTASAGSCNSPKVCGEAGRCIDARMREFVGPPAESTPVQADMVAELGNLLDSVGARVYINRSPKGCVCPFPRDKCPRCTEPCEECRKAAPPDDIRARLERLEERMDKQEALGGPNWSVGREAERFVTGESLAALPRSARAAAGAAADTPTPSIDGAGREWSPPEDPRVRRGARARCRIAGMDAARPAHGDGWAGRRLGAEG